jgi:hypothetical protein
MKGTYLHVLPFMPDGGGPHAILRARQNRHASGNFFPVAWSRAWEGGRRADTNFEVQCVSPTQAATCRLFVLVMVVEGYD